MALGRGLFNPNLAGSGMSRPRWLPREQVERYCETAAMEILAARKGGRVGRRWAFGAGS